MHLEQYETTTDQRTATDLVQLLGKLRWIGMEKEALRLEAALQSIPSDLRPSVLDFPTTD